MKSERRRKLETNDLAGWLEKVLEQSREYHTTALLILIGVILLFFVSGVYKNVTRNAKGNSWNEVYTLSGGGFVPLERILNGFQNPYMTTPDGRLLPPVEETGEAQAEGLAEFGAKRPTQYIGNYASLEAANLMLSEALGAVQLNQAKDAAEKLGKVKGMFESVVAATRTAAVRQQARYGLARTYEALAAVEKDKTKDHLAAAVDCYKKVADIGGALGAEAQKCLKVLEAPNSEALFVALANREEKKAEEEPASALPGLEEPALDEVKTEGIADELPLEAPAQAEPAAEAPAEAPAAEAAPAETPAEAPATEAAPAEAPAEAPAAEAAPAEPAPAEAPAAEAAPAEPAPAEAPAAEAAPAEAPAEAPAAEAAPAEAPAEAPAAEAAPAEAPAEAPAAEAAPAEAPAEAPAN